MAATVTVVLQGPDFVRMAQQALVPLGSNQISGVRADPSGLPVPLTSIEIALTILRGHLIPNATLTLLIDPSQVPLVWRDKVTQVLGLRIVFPPLASAPNPFTVGIKTVPPSGLWSVSPSALQEAITAQMLASTQTQTAARWQILQDTQAKIFQITQDVIVNKATLSANAFNRIDGYIK